MKMKNLDIEYWWSSIYYLNEKELIKATEDKPFEEMAENQDYGMMLRAQDRKRTVLIGLGNTRGRKWFYGDFIRKINQVM